MSTELPMGKIQEDEIHNLIKRGEQNIKDNDSMYVTRDLLCCVLEILRWQGKYDPLRSDYFWEKINSAYTLARSHVNHA